MNHSDIAALMKGVAPVIAELVTKTVQPLADRVVELEATIAELRNVDHAAIVADLVADAVGKIVLPAPEPGRDADPEETRRLVAEAVAALPAPEPGKPGEVDFVALAAMVDEAVAKLPPAEPGKSVTIEDVTPLLTELVAAEVAKLPPAEPAKSVSADDVEPMLADLVGKAVAALPAPEPGKPGAPGKLPVAKAWDGKVTYEAGVRTHDGALWQAIGDTGQEPGGEDWICLAAAGQSGKSADEIEVRETYDPDGDYRRLNIVALNGAAFIARKDDPGPCPGEGWQVIAMRGKPGPVTKGEPGKSVRGEPGPPVAAMSVDGEGMLTLRNGDGSEVRCDLYPVLSKLAG